MWRRFVGASVVLMVLCILGFVATLVWHGFGGDSDKYGRIDIPGSGTVTLPVGEVDVHYAVRLATNGSGGALTVPDLSFSMQAPDGARDPVVTEDIGGAVTVNSSAHVRVWKLQVKDPGVYEVRTEGDVQGFIAPQLTFGNGSPVPRWPLAVFGLLFLVALGLLLITAHSGRRDDAHSHRQQRPQPSPRSSSTSTPEQELARLARLQQLTDLHTSGTLSDAEYEAATSRLG